MYGTVAHMRMKPGAEEPLMAQLRAFGALPVQGYQATYVYRMDADPRDLYVAVIFDSKASYDANADSPEQDARYQEMLALLEGAPEWHDGEILAAVTGSVPV